MILSINFKCLCYELNSQVKINWIEQFQCCVDNFVDSVLFLCLFMENCYIWNFLYTECVIYDWVLTDIFGTCIKKEVNKTVYRRTTFTEVHVEIIGLQGEK